jgi:hypothetical protein
MPVGIGTLRSEDIGLGRNNFFFFWGGANLKLTTV